MRGGEWQDSKPWRLLVASWSGGNITKLRRRRGNLDFNFLVKVINVSVGFSHNKYNIMQEAMAKLKAVL